MTTLTIVAEAAFVNIVLPVAGNATGFQLGGIARFCVAGRTDQAPVLPREGETGRDIVIELPDLPAIDRVAAGTV